MLRIQAMPFKGLIIYMLLVPISCYSMSYRVRKGDTLWSISKKFNVPCSSLSAVNPLQNGKIMPGQVLSIPGGTIEYKVKKGDNITKIAREHNSNAYAVIKMNKLGTDSLIEGATLIIPQDAEGKYEKPPGKPKIFSNITGSKIHENPGQTPDFRNKKLVLPVDMDNVRDVRNNGRGVIVLLKAGSYVKSIQKGVVKFCNSMSGYDNVIIINYGDEFYGVYGFLGKILVHEGENVGESQFIGISGNVDSSGGQGIYLEIRYGRKSLNVKNFYPALDIKEIAMNKNPLMRQVE